MMQPNQVPPAARFIGAVFGLVFFGIGLTVVSFMIGSSSDGFGSPPVFFRIFASLIGVAFMAFGGTMAYSAISGGGLMKSPGARLHGLKTQLERDLPETTRPRQVAPGSYVCPSCGATLQKADVSPMGDVKCTFCGQWFNVHGKG